jgi:polysaccharide biosynthesis protein PslH
MRLAFVSLFQAYPPVSGAAYVTYNCARLAPCVSLLVQFAEHASVERVENLTIVSLRQRASSRLNKLLLMPLAIAQIRREVVRFKPDYIVLEGASWAVYLALVAYVLRKALPDTKIVYHAHNVEYLLRLERSSRVVTYLTRYAEKHLLTTCARSFAVSQEDRQRFLALYGIAPDLLPNGVDCSAEPASRDAIESVKKRFAITEESILFMGLYAYPPNTEAVRFLVDQVMPSLHLQRPNIRLIATGGGPPSSQPWLINTGLIPRTDLDAILGACRIGVAQILTGSGTRMKILEYMAAGLPVVTTRKGAEGLNLEGGRHALYAETPSEFQDALLRILGDQPLSESLSTQASALVRSRFDYSSLLRQFVDQLEGN